MENNIIEMITKNTLENIQNSSPMPNNNKKIAVIGKGTAGILQTLCLLDKGFQDVDIFYDPETRELPVGESTTPIVADILLNTLNIKISDLVEQGLASYKNAVRFINWGSGKSFNHYFAGNTVTLHFFTHKFNKFMCKKLEEHGINFISEKASDIYESNDYVCINGKKYDHIIHCTGWQENITNYVESEFESVNSAVVFTKNANTSFFETIHRAHEYGWQFELPFPEQGLSRCGFLFDRNFLSSKNVLNSFSDGSTKLLEWQPRYSDRLIKSNRQSLNGNCLFFLEPLQAFSTFYYITFGNMIASYLQDERPKPLINQEYLEKIRYYQSIIALHYSYGSTYDNKFWQDVTTKANRFLKINKIDKDLLHELALQSRGWYDFSLDGFSAEDFLQIHKGMQGQK